MQQLKLSALSLQRYWGALPGQDHLQRSFVLKKSYRAPRDLWASIDAISLKTASVFFFCTILYMPTRSITFFLLDVLVSLTVSVMLRKVERTNFTPRTIHAPKVCMYALNRTCLSIFVAQARNQEAEQKNPSNPWVGGLI